MKQPLKTIVLIFACSLLGCCNAPQMQSNMDSLPKAAARGDLKIEDIPNPGLQEEKKDLNELIEALEAHEDDMNLNLEVIQNKLKKILVNEEKISDIDKIKILTRVLKSTKETAETPKLLEILIKRKADVNGNLYGIAPLFQAANKNSFKLIQYLLEKGASVQKADEAAKKSSNSDYSLLEAILVKNQKLTRNEKKELLNTFLKDGVDINYRAKNGDHLLQKIIEANFNEQIQESLDILLADKDIIEQSLYYVYNFRTPWEYAAFNNKITVAEQLIGAMEPNKVYEKTIKAGETPDIATGNSQVERAQLYISYSSKAFRKSDQIKIQQAFIKLGIPKDNLPLLGAAGKD